MEEPDADNAPAAHDEGIDFDQQGIRLLVRQLESRPGIVPFVGAGLSESYGMPTWGRFLLGIADELNLVEAINALLDQGGYEEAAEVLIGAMGSLAFNDAVENAFGNHAFSAPPDTTAAGALVRLASGPVITTNFDHVLERVFSQAGSPFERFVWGGRISQAVVALQQDSHFLFKIHGDVDDPEDRVLTRTEYEARYGDLLVGETASTPLGTLLHRTIESRTLLFVGCSLRSDRIVTILDHAARRPGAFTHFAIVARPSSPEAFRERQHFLSVRNIRPIWFPEGRYDLLPSLLEHIADLVGASVGGPPLSPLVPPDSYFAPLLGAEGSRLLHYQWELVGRERTLDELNDWADGDRPVAFLVGRGGIGKTKILQGFSDGFAADHPGVSILFATSGVPFTSENVSRAIVGPTVVVVDDAHHRDDLGFLLELARRAEGRVRVLLATRPYRVESLRTVLTASRFDIREVVTVGPLDELTLDETEQLARQALGDEGDRYAKRLAEATRDSPFVTVLGGQLLTEKRVPPELLERDDDFRRILLDRFRDEVTATALTESDPKLVERLLPVVAALSPINPEDGAFLPAVARYLGVSTGEIVQTLDALEFGGVLARRGRLLRITPDVLSDHLLHRACVGAVGTPTGFAQDVFQAFRDQYMQKVLGNLAELDWRIKASDGAGSALLDDIWATLEGDLERASNRGREILLEKLSDVAYHQPDRVLALVEFAMLHPVVDDDPGVPPYQRGSHTAVLERLPALLRGASYSGEFLRRCCDLLWELGRDDARPLNQHPDHAMRILEDIAGYAVDKPYWVSHLALDAATDWLRAPDAHAHLHSPVDVLDAVLVRSGHSTRADGYRAVFLPFVVDLEETSTLRSQAFELLISCLKGANRKTKLRILESLFRLAEPPRMPTGGFVAEDDEQGNIWWPERVIAFDCIRELVASDSDPIVQLKVADGLSWYIEFRPKQLDGEISAQILAGITETPELQLLALLSGKFDIIPIKLEEEGKGACRDARKARDEEVADRYAKAFFESHPAPSTAATAIDAALGQLSDSGIQLFPTHLWSVLAGGGIEYLVGLARYCIENPVSHFARYLGVILANLRQVDRDGASTLAHLGLETGDIQIAASISNWARLSAKDPTIADINLVRILVAHEHLGIRRNAIGSLGSLGRVDARAAAEIALSVDIGTSTELADALCSVFDGPFGVEPTVLEEDDVAAILAKLQDVDDLDDYHVLRFLTFAATRTPLSIVQLFVDRVRNDVAKERSGFRPLPFHGLADVFVGKKNHPQFRAMIEIVRAEALADDWGTRWWIPKLFAAVSDHFSDESLNIVSEWAASADPEEVRAAARLLSASPPNFIFVQKKLVVALLQRAYELGGDAFQEVSSNLRKSAWTQPRSRTLGVDPVYPEDVELLRNANEAMADLVPGSPQHRFYADLREVADANMRRERLRDEEEFG